MSEQWQDEPTALILVDFSAIAYACWYSAVKAQETAASALDEHVRACPNCARSHACTNIPVQYDVHAVLRDNLLLKLDTIVADTPANSVNDLVLVLDSHPGWKYDLYPAYKGKRVRDVDPRQEAEAFLRRECSNIRWVQAPGQEADDAIATLVAANKSQRHVVIVSGDKDLWQLFDPPTVRIYAPTTKRWLDADKIAQDFYGLAPQHIRLAKAIWGDTSDNLPNCAPRAQKQLVPLITSCDGALLDVIKKAKEQVNQTCMAHLSKNIDQIIKNYTLVGLRMDAALNWT